MDEDNNQPSFWDRLIAPVTQGISYQPSGLDYINPIAYWAGITENIAAKNRQQQIEQQAYQQDLAAGRIPGTPQYEQQQAYQKAIAARDEIWGKDIQQPTTAQDQSIPTVVDEYGYAPGDEDNPYLANDFGVADTGTYGVGGGITLEQEIPNVEPFTFDLEAAQKKAYAALQPFYNRLLEFAQGDLNLAKRILEFSYQQGIRESTQEFEQNIADLEALFPEETAQLVTGLNKRGVYFSGFGGEQRERLTGSQERRRLAEERALQNRESRLKEARETGLQEEQSKYEKTAFEQKRAREKEADVMATKEYGMAYDKYGAQLRKQEQEEARRVQGLANQATAGTLSTGQTSGGSRPAGYGTGDAEFRRYMQTTGRQGELDTATKGSTTQGAEYEALKKKYGF